MNIKKQLLIFLFSLITIGLYSQTNGNYNWILAQDGATSGQYLKWNGSGWVPSTIAYGDFSSALKDSLAVVVISSVSEFANYPNTLRQKVIFWNDAKRGGIFVLKQSGSPNGATVFQGTPSANKWVRVTEDERIDCKWFGATGDGTTDDDTPMQAWANYIGNNNLHGYVSAGTYLTHSTITIDSFSNVVVSGDGPLSVIKRKANTALSTTNTGGSLTRLLRLSGAGGDYATVYSLTFDGNGQNQGSPDSSTAWQQYHSLYFAPSGSLGFGYIDVHDIISLNPLGDGVSISGSSSDGVGEVTISHIEEPTRSYTRSTVTLTSGFNKVTATNIIGTSFQVEPNGFSGPSTTYRFNLNLSNSSLKELDVNLLGARAAGRTGDFNISNTTVRGKTVIQEFNSNVSGCKFYLSEPFRMAYGSYRIEQTLFYADSAFDVTTGSFMVYQASANPTDYAYFRDCDFKKHSSPTLTYAYSDDNGFGTNTREISFQDCRFGDATNIIRTAGVRSGKFIFDNCVHSYATSNSACINYQGSAAKSSITNEMHVYRNKIENNTAYLVGHPLASNMLRYYSKDNKVWDGQLIYWSRYDSIGGLKGPVTNLRVETPAIYYQSESSSLSATNKPNTGRWAKGDIFYYAVPINGWIGVVCDTSGNGDGTSATGSTTGAKFSYFGSVNEAVNSALAGDVSGEPNANVIGNNKVTNAKLATAASWTLKGRNAGSTGNVSDMAVTDFTTDASPASGEYVIGFDAGGLVKYDIAGILGGGTSYTFSTGLTNSSGTITSNLSTGVSGGQSVIGGTAASNNLTLSSTSNATKGKILFGTSGYDEANNRLGLGTASPGELLSLGSTGATLGVMSFAGNTSGKVTMQPAAAAGTWTLTLPTSGGTNGYVLQTDGSGTTSWVAQSGGGITGTGVANDVTYWTGASTISRDTFFHYNSSHQLSVGTTTPKGSTMFTTKGTGTSTTTFGYTHQNSSGTTVFQVKDDGSLAIGSSNIATINTTDFTPATAYTFGGASVQVSLTSSQNSASAVSINASATNGYIRLGNGNINATSGAKVVAQFDNVFNPTSGTETFTALSMANTINQTSTASGATTLINVSPTVTSALGAITFVDINPTITTASGTVKGVNIGYNNSAYYGIYQSGASTLNYFNGNVGIGTSSPGSNKLYVVGQTRIDLGSDANYDMFYRNSSGLFTRLANGTTGQVLSATTSSAPSWATATFTENTYYVESQTGTTLNLSTGSLAKTKGTGTGVNVDLPTNLMKVDVYKNGARLAYTDGSTTRDYSYNAATDTFTFQVALVSTDRIDITVRN